MSSTLDERGRRRWCAAEARSHGRGGIAAVARVTGVSRRTIDRGLLVRRESHDYYGHSVTMGLAPRRRSRVRPCCTSERDVGVPLISLIALTGQRSTPRRLRQPTKKAVAEHGAGHKRLSGRRIVASSGDWDSGNPAFAISRGSRDTPAQTPRLTIASMACCCPVHLSDPGKPLDPRTSLRVPPG